MLAQWWLLAAALPLLACCTIISPVCCTFVSLVCVNRVVCGYAVGLLQVRLTFPFPNKMSITLEIR